MSKFKLCEEMGLEVSRIGDTMDSNFNQYIKASDVEKMLEGGILCDAPKFGERGYEAIKSIAIPIPQKHKPVSKEEILYFLKNNSHKWSSESNELLERIEKHGIK